MSTMQIGKPNYNRSNSEKLTYYSLGMKDNQRELTLLLAPPIKSMAEKGDLSVYLKQHFGYTIPGKADKAIPMTFNCIERRDRNKNITQECPECNEISLKQASLEAMHAKLTHEKVAPELIEAQLRPQKEWLKSHNLDRKHNLLAKSESGTWGILRLGHKAFQDLLREISDLRKDGILEPVGMNGVWFRFTRTGASFNDIKDTCKAVQVRDGKTFTFKEGPLLDSDLSALEALPELTSLGRRLSFDQIKLLVESGGDENVVSSVFNAGQRQEVSSVRTGPAPSTVQVVVNNPAAQTVQNVPQVRNEPAPMSAQDTQAALMAQLKTAQEALAKLQGQGAQTQAQTQVQAPAKVTPKMQTQLDMDPDEFMAKFGNGG